MSDVSPEFIRQENTPRSSRGVFSQVFHFLVISFLVGACGTTLYGYFLNQAPDEFPSSEIFSISQGASLSEIAHSLEEKKYINNAYLFRVFARLLEHDTEIVAGEYFFDTPISTLAILDKLAHGEHGITKIKLTVPEGFTREQIANTATTLLPSFDRSTFLSMTKDEEGMLFPDTYLFYETATTGQVVNDMRENFTKKISAVEGELSQSKRSLREVIILASLIEEEVQTEEDRKIVAGIIENRLAKNMPLQIDATFQYIIGKGSAELTLDDLAVDSPYNTYRNKGLPPTAISNPGIQSILAVLNPTPTPYLFYLSDKNGKTHYAKTFEEHKINKAKYLR